MHIGRSDLVGPVAIRVCVAHTKPQFEAASVIGRIMKFGLIVARDGTDHHSVARKLGQGWYFPVDHVYAAVPIWVIITPKRRIII